MAYPMMDLLYISKRDELFIFSFMLIRRVHGAVACRHGGCLSNYLRLNAATILLLLQQLLSQGKKIMMKVRATAGRTAVESN